MTPNEKIGALHALAAVFEQITKLKEPNGEFNYKYAYDVKVIVVACATIAKNLAEFPEKIEELPTPVPIPRSPTSISEDVPF